MRALEMAVWAALALWATSPLQSLLSGADPSLPTAAQAGTPLYRDLRYLGGLVCLACALSKPERLRRICLTAWPLLAFLAYAVLSAVWSMDRSTSLKGLLAGGATLATALALSVALPPPRLLATLRLTLGLAALGSVVAVILLPHYAVAGAQDAVGASAAGAWRGLYGHKNALGHVAALAAALNAPSVSRPTWRRAFDGLAFAAAIACVLGSRSATGLLIALGAPLLLYASRGGRPSRLLALGLSGLGLAVLVVQIGWMDFGLAALGRDATLSGRTAIWRYTVSQSAPGLILSPRTLFGSGLDYAVSPAVSEPLTQLYEVNHVHNAALDLYLGLGGAGLLLAALALGAGLWPTAGGSAARSGLALLILGWLLSGLSEDMAVRADGPMATLGLCALFGLYATRSGRRSFRRPVFGFWPAWIAPLRPPRLRSAA